MLMHWLALGPLSMHSEPMGIMPWWIVHVVADGSDADDVEVAVRVIGSTVSGPQSPSSGHGSASLGGRGLPGIPP